VTRFILASVPYFSRI